MPKVSVVIPVYNVEKYLDRCVQSIRNQTLQDIEIILVDDESPDNCPAMCNKYAETDNRIKVIHKKNGGLGMACNSGIEVATGEYVAFCDSDDWVDSMMYQELYDSAVENSADVVFSGLKRVNARGEILGYMHHPESTSVYEGSEIEKLMNDLICADVTERYDHGIQVSAKVVLYRKSFLDEFSLRFVSEREYPSEDLIFNVSVLSVASKAVVLDKFFYNYFVNDSSISTTLKEDRFNKLLESANLIHQIISTNDRWCNSCSYKIRLARLIIGEARTHARLIVNSDCVSEHKKALLRSLSSNRFLVDAVSYYPLNKMPFKHKYAIKLILSSNYPLIKLLFKFS